MTDKGSVSQIVQQLGLIIACSALVYAQPSVLTWHNDNARTGQNLQETTLTPSNVNSTMFGKLFVMSADGKVDAQPLYVPGVTLSNVKHNVLFVVTEHDSAYAFDADTGAGLWHVSLLGAGETPSDDHGCSQVTPEIGATATPVIDTQVGTHGTIYIVATSKDGSGGYHHRLHALDITTGSEQFGGPVEVQATSSGSGVENTFNPTVHKERPGLLIVNGVVYTSWSSHCDGGSYVGWVIGYNETNLQQAGVLNLIPNGNDGGIWNAGAGPAADASGNIFLITGNGTFDTTLDVNGFPNKGDYGNAIVKISTTSGPLTVVDYFTMSNTVSETNGDTDFGSGGGILLPPLADSQGHLRDLAVGAGKDRHMYVVDRSNMGKFNSGNNNIYQDLPSALPGGTFSTPAWFNGHLYYGDVGGTLKAFAFVGGSFQSTPSSHSATSFPYPGTTPSVSANGTLNGIVWAVENSGTQVLHAYDAGNLATELYNSNQAANGRDHFGSGNKFMVPTIANGKVYVGTTNGVGAFGLLCTYSIMPQTTPAPSGGGTQSVNVTAANGCGWSASSNSAFLSINSGTPGSGNGTVMYQVQANTGPARSGTLTIAGQTLTVNQAAGPPDLTITKTHTPPFNAGDTGKTYTITVSNVGGSATSGTVTVTDTVPSGLTATGIAGTGWSCMQPAGPCTRSDALAAGMSYLGLTLTVNVSAQAPSSVTNTASVSGGGEVNTSNDTANDPTTINPASGTDLAIGKAATQSSTLGGYGNIPNASSAVDGNTDGNFFHGSVSHTNSDANAWWQVDLGNSASITSIAIWNRTDCCMDRLSDFWVFVSNTPFGPSDTPTTLQGRAGTWNNHQTTFPNPSVTLAVNAQGRYVRVQLSGTTFLSLAEVQVYGTFVSNSSTNLAVGKAATQSSTLSGYGPTTVASSAVDGNTDGNFFNGSVSHTNSDPNAWWQVDLGNSASVTSVAVWNRTDCCMDRLSDYWVFISDTPFAVSDTPATLQNRANTWSSHQTTFPNPSATISANAQGRYVRVQLSGTNFLHLAEVQVYGTFVSNSNTNLAVGKAATQSSTLGGYSTDGPGSAVDGNTDGNFFDGSVTHTANDANAWWQVDLGNSASVTSIKIWNRTDCCMDRLIDYWIFVSDTPFGPSDTPATLQSRPNTWSNHQTTFPNPSTTLAVNAQGRYVRVQLSGTNFLNLAEVQVYGTFVSNTNSNVALGKAATQSSTLGGYSTDGPGSAVDGNTDGNFFDGSVTHTANDANAWWQVDLGASYSVSSIAIWNRTDCCMDRLSDYWVFVSDTPFQATDTPTTLQSRPNTWNTHQTSFPNPSTTLPVNAQGRYVRVQLSGTNFLNLAEVQVFGH